MDKYLHIEQESCAIDSWCAGFTFNNHYTTIALCCPARAAMLRGQHAHNTNNTNVELPGGSFQKFRASGANDNNLPHYLNRAGYRTEFIGKIMNGYGVWNWDTPPAGWDRFDGMIDPCESPRAVIKG